MKLLKLKVFDYKNLKDVEIDFSKSSGMTLVVGTNGSGKSNLLEVLSAIFSALFNKEKNVTPDFRFELKYIIDSKYSTIEGIQTNSSKIEVNICNYDGTLDMSFCCLSFENEFHKLNPENHKLLLPDHVIAIYSGEEKRLWENYYFQSYDNYNKQYMEGKQAFQQHNMVYLNHYYWNLIASILLIHDIDDYRIFINEQIGIKDILSIHCEFDVAKIKRNKNERVKQILKIINPNNESHVDISLETYRLVKNYCGYEADMFFNMLVLTLYKDFKIITDLTLKCKNSVEIRDLSEGEKKLLLVYGAINLLSGENLYLLDEPDAHLHEGRKREMFELLQQDINNHFVVSSHSPTLTKLFNYEHVVLLEKTDSGCKVSYGDVVNTITKLTNGEWKYIEQVMLFENSRPLILVEGPGDVKYILKAIEILSEDKEQYKILKSADILHCGGASNIQRTINEIRPSLSENKKIIALFDNDDAGRTELKKAIGKGKDRADTKTYKKDGVIYLKLPRLHGYGTKDFVIEDYFSESMMKSTITAIIDNFDDTFNSIAKDLKQKVKEKLELDLDKYNNEALKGFEVLLDKLCSIVTDTEECEEV